MVSHLSSLGVADNNWNSYLCSYCLYKQTPMFWDMFWELLVGSLGNLWWPLAPNFPNWEILRLEATKAAKDIANGRSCVSLGWHLLPVRTPNRVEPFCTAVASNRTRLPVLALARWTLAHWCICHLPGNERNEVSEQCLSPRWDLFGFFCPPPPARLLKTMK